MKTTFLFGILFAALGAHGAMYDETFTENTAIPDGNPVGVSFAETFNQDPNAGDTVGGLTLTLNVSGGYNGDLYAYAVSPNGAKVVLLNQPGVSSSNPFGYGGSGMNVTLSDSAPTSIQSMPETSGAVFTGTYQAAGALSGFNGSTADGGWTLFFADLSNGGGTSELNSWSLDISAVPEPMNEALIIFGGMVGLIALARAKGVKRLWQKSRFGKTLIEEAPHNE